LAGYSHTILALYDKDSRFATGMRNMLTPDLSKEDIANA